MPTWTIPKTWESGDIVTAADLNTHLRDNMLYLKSANQFALAESDQNYTTTTTTWADIDASNLSLDITTHGGVCLVTFTGALTYGSSLSGAYLDFTVDGTRQGGTYGLTRLLMDGSNLNTTQPIVWGFQWWLPSLAAGNHTLRAQWRQTSAGTQLKLHRSADGGIPTRLACLELDI